ncbi:hypothetical protein BDA96_02G195700 [Sorghum bicolor]|nr:uncharacterized protein LOC8065372 [Sorghum bicolor]KAG0543498.1 hypothetical protein BDA96_02G195700 [Sorghum bicolor]|eukprot:XP_021310465.1 uncharacterized protein LOC8065372 [Sorghum bicolor]
MASREGGGGGAAAAGRPALRVGRTREYRTGMETELLSIDAGASGGGAAVRLFVLCGDRFEAAHLFRSGGLSLSMARVEGLPVSMATCTVGDHQWMLARDALVARIDARAFVFELPGFFYAVVVPPDAAGGAADRKCATMADIFSRFCAYHDLAAAAADGVDEPAGDLNTNPWVRAHARIQRLKTHASPAGQAAADAPSDRARQMERAVRTSAVVKLLTRSLLAGVLQPGRHLTITTGGGAANAGTSSRPSTAALPSKSVVSDLLDAIETNRAAPRRDAARRGSGGSAGLGWWNLNVEGIMLLLRVVQAVRGRRHLAAPAAGEKRPRDEGPGRDTMRGGVMGGGGAARRWCGGRSRKIGNTVGACGSS